MGLAKLWWSNRQLRKHQVIDDERQARIHDMRQSGIETTPLDEIPFGVRALESGVVVQGIWVSASNSPGHGSRPSSPASPIVQDGERSKGKEKMRASISASPELAPEPSPSLLIVSPIPSARPWPPNPAACWTDAMESAEGGLLPWEIRPSSRPTSGLHPSQEEAPKPAERALTTTLYGAAEVYANRTIRRTNTGFQVLPAGALGPRQELMSPESEAEMAAEEEKAKGRQSAGQAKLRKRPRV